MMAALEGTLPLAWQKSVSRWQAYGLVPTLFSLSGLDACEGRSKGFFNKLPNAP
jgi:hypothetical protein